MISCYDQRTLDDIRDVLLSSEINHDDLVSACVVLLEHISKLERAQERANKATRRITRRLIRNVAGDGGPLPV